jgi:tetratricopeptide (TPR) repeat protein
MHRQSLTAKRIFLNACLAATVGIILSAPVVAVGRAQEPSERQRAFDLLHENKYVEALPLFEKLATANPDDPQLIYWLGFLHIAKANNLKDPAERKAERKRGREFLVRAKELGARDELSENLLKSVPPDGGDDPNLSNNVSADAAMKDAEAAFARGELDKAVGFYALALQLDPKLYLAPLYAGDMEYRKGLNSTDPQTRSVQFDKAGVWYAKAIALDPDRETAYRYWGDALLKQGKADDARSRYIEAIIAEPYNSFVYNGIKQWANEKDVELGHPRIEQPAPSIRSEKSGDKTTILIDPSKLDPTSPAYYWSFYDLTRVAYKTASFARDYPDEKEYRHSLKEEANALRAVAEIASKDFKAGKTKLLDVSLHNLIKLYESGFLESYVLYARADAGIARDYVAYRATNRDKLRRYWLEVVIGG